MRFVPFEPEHLFEVEAQAHQRPFVEWMTPDIALAAARSFSFTGIDDDGAKIGCAGLAPAPEGDALVAWALFSERIQTHRLAVTRAVKQGLDLHRTRRIIAHVAAEHVKAARFAEALDFHLCGQAVHPNGRSVLLYAREC